MKSYLKYGFFALLGVLFVSVVFVFLFISKDDTPQLQVKPLDDNITELIPIPPTQLPSKKLVKGLFADYDPETFPKDFNETNATNFNVSVKELNNSKENNLNFLIDFNLSKNQLFNNQIDYFELFKGLKFQSAPKEEQNTSKKSPLIFKEDKGKAKLSIIIDDMASKEQAMQLKATGLKLTPSFFPADKNHPKTPHLAREFDFFMVHLPLAAINFKGEEIQTLKPNDTQEHIDTKIEQITKDFEGIKFINNHTGSLFTNNTNAMRKLLQAFEKHNLIFVDSATIGSSKGVLVSKEFGQVPIKRDIFLDNKDDIASIKAQIKKAVKLAHKKGFAIAIAHPRKNTFKALEQSKDLLQSVELVYLSEVYENP